MSAPSKEALESAQLLVYSYDPKALEDGARLIDRHFAPLRQRAEQAEARVKELEAWNFKVPSLEEVHRELLRQRDQAWADNAALRARVADWKKCADLAESALASEQQRNDELVAALREIADVNFDCSPVVVARDALARAESASPAKHPSTCEQGSWHIDAARKQEAAR